MISEAPDTTFGFGEALGRVLQSGDFVGLTGQLGAGKTLFSRGVAQGAGVPVDDVSSPTYSIIQTYRGRLPLHHMDLYRLRSDADLISTGYYDLLEEDGAFLVEWIDQVPGAAPADTLRIVIEVPTPATREFKVTTSGPKSELLLQRWTAERTKSAQG